MAQRICFNVNRTKRLSFSAINSLHSLQLPFTKLRQRQRIASDCRLQAFPPLRTGARTVEPKTIAEFFYCFFQVFLRNTDSHSQGLVRRPAPFEEPHMKDRSAQALENIYEMWMRFQSLSESGDFSGADEASSDSAPAPTMTLPARGQRFRQSYPGPIAITQFFLTICVRPAPEVLVMLPDELFIRC